ncbi:MAG: nucleotidyltransferase, partial [Candidatus Sumerlaeia bacterium]
FNVLADYLREISAKPADAKPEEYAMVGFQLRQTLSEFGHVSRGVCTLGPQDYLENIEEVTQIQPDGQGGAEYPDADGSMQKLTGDEVVSMNLWGFPPSIFDHLDKGFQSFMADHGTEEKSEFYLPAAVNHLVDLGQARVKVLKTPDSWFGVTYREDKEFVDKNIRQRIDSGLYPEKLW